MEEFIIASFERTSTFWHLEGASKKLKKICHFQIKIFDSMRELLLNNIAKKMRRIHLSKENWATNPRNTEGTVCACDTKLKHKH